MAERTKRDGDCVEIGWLRVVNFKERETEKATEQRGFQERENDREKTLERGRRLQSSRAGTHLLFG